MTEAITYPGARRPDRQRSVDSLGLAIAVHEWGDEAASPLVLAHGGFDFAGTFDVFAPMLAEAGWRQRLVWVGSVRHRAVWEAPHGTDRWWGRVTRTAS